MKISNISTGFYEIPGKISLNVFVQGCKIQCKGCQNKDLWDFLGGKDIFGVDLIQILDNKELATWICWLGGEPTDQPEDFVKFNQIIKKSSRKYGVCLYTGRYFYEIEHLLTDVDMVVDGPWEGIPINDEKTNQKVFLKRNSEWICVKMADVKELLKEEDTHADKTIV